MRRHKYVELSSVLAIFLAGSAIISEGIFLAAFLYRAGKVEGRFDFINIEVNVLNIVTIASVFGIFIFLVLNPLQYSNER